MSKRARRLKTRLDRKRKKAEKAGGAKPINTIFMMNDDELDCACPMCAELAARGEPVMIMRPDGTSVERIPNKPEMMQVFVLGTASTWPHFGPEPKPVRVPVGCIVGDMLEYLCFDREIRISFPPGALRGQIDGQPCEPDRVLMPGETVTLSAVKDPEGSRFLAALLKPFPAEP